MTKPKLVASTKGLPPKISDQTALGIVTGNLMKALGRAEPRVMTAAVSIVSAQVIMQSNPDPKARMFNYLQFLKGVKSAMKLQAEAEGTRDPLSYAGLPEDQLKPSGLILPEPIKGH